MNQVTWNNLVKEYAPPFGAFLQSWQWGEFQKACGRQVERLHLPGAHCEVVAQAVGMDLPLGQMYWYLPKGPLGYGSADTLIEQVRAALPPAMFLRAEPCGSSGFMKVDDVQPKATTVIDLKQGTDKIIAGFKSKTRYNYRLAQKKGVTCRFVTLDCFDDFMRLMEQTATRDHFHAHPESYYRKMLEVLSGDDVQVHLAMAYFDGRPLAGNIVIDFAGTRTYLHGATSNLHRDVMAQYALHVFLITDAVQAGLATFDFWGIAPPEALSDHPWAGITRYKLGFGGQYIEMPGTFDLPMKHFWYSLYGWGRNLRRTIRR